jgi:hypothetical protein
MKAFLTVVAFFPSQHITLLLKSDLDRLQTVAAVLGNRTSKKIKKYGRNSCCNQAASCGALSRAGVP